MLTLKVSCYCQNNEYETKAKHILESWLPGDKARNYSLTKSCFAFVSLLLKHQLVLIYVNWDSQCSRAIAPFPLLSLKGQYSEFLSDK